MIIFRIEEGKPWTLKATLSAPAVSTHDHEAHRSPGSFSGPLYELAVAGMPLQGRPSLQSMPSWVQALWHGVFLHQAESDGYREDGPSITVVTWFLHEDYHFQCRRPRWLHLDIEHEHWAEHLQELWRDLWDFALDYEIHLVDPEPPRAAGENHQCHLLIVQRPHPHLSRAVLLTTQLVTAHSRLSRTAALVQPALTRDSILRLENLQHDCHILVCTVMTKDDVIVDYPFFLADGMGIIIYGEGRSTGAPFQERTLHAHYDEEADHHVLLATNRLFPRAQDPQDIQPADAPDDSSAEESSSPQYGYDVDIDPDSDWISAILFTRNGDGVVGRIQEVHPELEHREVAYMLGITPNSLLAVHSIRAPPQDITAAGQYAYVVQQLNDVPVGSLGRLILVDVIFCAHLPQLEPETIRQIKILPDGVSAHQVLGLLRLRHYCLQQGVHCLMHLNNRLVRLDRDSNLALDHGDYLRVTLSPPPGCPTPTISTRLACLARLHGLSEAAYPHLQLQLPHTMSLDQVPNPEIYLQNLEEAESFALL